MSEETLAAVMARIEGEAPAAATPAAASPDALAVPEPLRGYLGGGLDALP